MRGMQRLTEQGTQSPTRVAQSKGDQCGQRHAGPRSVVAELRRARNWEVSGRQRRTDQRFVSTVPC